MSSPAVVSVQVVVDAANVVGSRPDGWWRDRAGAAARLLQRLAALPGAVTEAGGATVEVAGVVVVLEGQARAADPGHRGSGGDAGPVRVVSAPGSGDDTIVEVCGATPGPLVVVTADRGLRARLPARATAVGPRWLDGMPAR